MTINSHTTGQIIEAAKEAASWVELRWDSNNPRSSLRNLEFSPEFFGNDNYYTVNSIIYARRYELEKLKVTPHKDLSKGRILVYEPDSNLFDGLSESETDGYLDVNDCPHWDTWIGYVVSNETRYVLSWVPHELVSLIDTGAEVNCVDCFYWLSEVKDPWARELKNA